MNEDENAFYKMSVKIYGWLTILLLIFVCIPVVVLRTVPYENKAFLYYIPYNIIRI